MEHTIPGWRKIQRENFTSLQKLSSFLELDPSQHAQLFENKKFPLNLPRRLAEKIEKNNINDPIFKQFVPLYQEKQSPLHFLKDPVGDCQAARSAKYLHKYEGRVLLLTSSACAMHCRYCFRQNYDYAPLQTGFEKELALIRQDSTIAEVILSGGDPLSLGNLELKKLIEAIAVIPHVKRLRFHTRFPIGIPERIDTEFLQILENVRLQVWFIIHCNHPKELDSDVIAALKKVQRLGIPVMNQWVLLKGINDSLPILEELCTQLIDHGVIPYYLHQLDRVEGAAHFEVPPEEGISLIQALKKRLSGYAIPSYVQEVAGAASKIGIV